MSLPREEGAAVDTDARAAHAAVDERGTNAAASSSKEPADAQGGSPPLSFSPRRVGPSQDAGAQQQ
jgi:hypothetical protein